MRRSLHGVDFGAGAVAVTALGLIYAPLVVVAVFSLWQPVRVQGSLRLASFSLDSYVHLLGNRDILDAVVTTVGVGAAASATGLVLGTIFAFFYLRTAGWARQAMQGLIFLPFLLPPIITGLALLIAFRELDLTRGFLTIIAGHILLVVPVIYRTVLVRLNALSPSLREASLDLGASERQTFQYILLPQLRTALIAAALLAFAISFDETMVTLFLCGSTNTLPIRLWAMMRLGFVPDINALATLIVVLAAAATMLIGSLQIGRSRGGAPGPHPAR